MIGQTISHYRILEKLGEGGMGVVYKAHDDKLDRDVALKFLHPHSVASEKEAARFQQEARALSALNHPNIATIHHIEESDNGAFLVLEYLPCGTLKSRIDQLYSSGEQLPLSEIIECSLQMTEGLAHAHREGIIHRDIKTENVMLTKEGRVKITDFGLAKLQAGAQLTKSGHVVGTVAYMSPEQIRGDDVDHRADLFSLGIVLFELCTGRLPFRGEHEAALGYSIVNEDPISLESLRPDLPASVHSVVSRCLEKERANRFQGADEIEAELRNIQVAISGHVTRAPKRPIRLRTPLVIGVAGMVLVFVASYFFLPGKSGRPAEKKSIIVLPFKNLNNTEESQYFTDGITEDIITQVSKIHTLRVLSRASALKYRNTDKSIREIGSELGVAAVLEGSVRRSGNQLRITAQLVDASNDEHLWAEAYDKELTQIFAIQSDVARQIAAALQAELSSDEKERIAKKPTENLTAYEYYLKGRQYYYRYHKQDNESAIDLFKKALALDQNYALAYAGLGDAYAQRVGRFGFAANWFDSSIAVSNKAIAIDPNLAEPFKALGLAYAIKGWHRKALEGYRRAVQLNPNYATAVGNYGQLLANKGDLVEGMKWLRESVKLDPTNGYYYFAVGDVYLDLADDVNAEEWYTKALNLQPDLLYAYFGFARLYTNTKKYQDAVNMGKIIFSIDPENLPTFNMLGYVHLFLNDYTQAKTYFEKAITIDSPNGNLAALGYIYWKSGQADKARTLFSERMTNVEKELAQGNESHDLAYDATVINAVQGNTQEANRWLQRAIDAGWRDFRFALLNPEFENIRNDPQFKHIVGQLRARVDSMRGVVSAMEKQ